jgi:cytochrome c556
MKRALVWITALSLSLAAGAAAAKDEKPSEIKEIMTKINKPSTGLAANIASELRSDSPDWKEIQPQAKEMVKLTAQLGKYKPPMGDEASWAKLTKEFAANTVALEKAIAAKDQPAAKAAFEKGEKACSACHKAHRKE